MIWRVMLCLAPDAIPFDIRTVPPAADEIVVTAHGDDLRYRLDPGNNREQQSNAFRLKLGNGTVAEPDTQTGRFGETQVTIRLKVPF